MNAWASTNLANMGDHPVEALITSAFLFGPDPWACLRSIALAGAMLAFLVIRFGDMRAVALIAAGQVLGTLVSEGLLAARISAGQADPALRATLDVGPSYVIVSALAAVVAAGARRWHRWTALAALVVRAPHITSGLTTLGVTPVGHITALSTGMLLAWGLRSSDAVRGQFPGAPEERRIALERFLARRPELMPYAGNLLRRCRQSPAPTRHRAARGRDVAEVRGVRGGGADTTRNHPRSPEVRPLARNRLAAGEAGESGPVGEGGALGDVEDGGVEGAVDY
ncbi:MAG: hypothetical protein HOY79_42855 [Streptomyces sp.]|nr:hypothetical protein [Streptomyces sp.]